MLKRTVRFEENCTERTGLRRRMVLFGVGCIPKDAATLGIVHSEEWCDVRRGVRRRNSVPQGMLCFKECWAARCVAKKEMV